MLRKCIVSFTDPAGLKHSVSVTSESVYGAAIGGVKAISEAWGEAPGPTTLITVEVVPPTVTYQVNLHQLRKWLDTENRDLRDKLIKDNFRQILDGIV